MGQARTCRRPRLRWYFQATIRSPPVVDLRWLARNSLSRRRRGEPLPGSSTRGHSEVGGIGLPSGTCWTGNLRRVISDLFGVPSLNEVGLVPRNRHPQWWPPLGTSWPCAGSFRWPPPPSSDGLNPERAPTPRALAVRRARDAVRSRTASDRGGGHMRLHRPDVSLIDRTKIQAEVALPLFKALEQELGIERARTLVRQALADEFRQLARDWVEEAAGDHMAAFMRFAAYSNADDPLVYEARDAEPGEMRFDVLSCPVRTVLPGARRARVGFPAGLQRRRADRRGPRHRTRADPDADAGRHPLRLPLPPGGDERGVGRNLTTAVADAPPAPETRTCPRSVADATRRNPAKLEPTNGTLARDEAIEPRDLLKPARHRHQPTTSAITPNHPGPGRCSDGEKPAGRQLWLELRSIEAPHRNREGASRGTERRATSSRNSEGRAVSRSTSRSEGRSPSGR